MEFVPLGVADFIARKTSLITEGMAWAGIVLHFRAAASSPIVRHCLSPQPRGGRPSTAALTMSAAINAKRSVLTSRKASVRTPHEEPAP